MVSRRGGGTACALATRMYAHYVAHARPGLAPLFDHDRARWLWQRLRAAFGTALAAILMPNHLHFVDVLRDEARRTFAAILGAFARRFGLGEVWQPVPEAEPLTTPDKLARGVRYTVLNCCRPWYRGGEGVRLARDPLAWPWSTHRDVVGAIVDPWIDVQRLARSLGWRARDPRSSIHRWVSSDPHVSASGTPLPVIAEPSAAPAGTLHELARAALAATRSPATALRRRTPARRVFVGLSYRQGWRNASVLAAACDLHPDAVARTARTCPPDWLTAAALCLGDPRLLEGTPRVDLFRPECQSA